MSFTPHMSPIYIRSQFVSGWLITAFEDWALEKTKWWTNFEVNEGKISNGG